VTGLVLYVVPQGRISYWVEWTFLGINKEQWGAIHVLSMFLFLLSILFHLYFNWKPLMSYLKSRVAKRLGARPELALATLISVLFVVSGIWEFRPLSYLLDVEQKLKDSWVESAQDEPPFGHAELLKLSSLFKKTNIPVDKALEVLQAKGLTGVAADRILVELARDNDMSPRDVFLLVQSLERKPNLEVPDTGTGFTDEYVEETFANSGVGRKTISEIAAQLDLEPSTLENRLKRKGITFEPEQSIKQIASENQMKTPLEALKSMLIE